jgi:hypothetical protein
MSPQTKMQPSSKFSGEEFEGVRESRLKKKFSPITLNLRTESLYHNTHESVSFNKTVAQM